MGACSHFYACALMVLESAQVSRASKAAFRQRILAQTARDAGGAPVDAALMVAHLVSFDPFP